MPLIALPRLLELLSYSPGEHLAICHKHHPDGMFTGHVVPYPLPAEEGARAGELMAAHADLWYGVNPVVGPPGRTGRGTVEQVTRLAALVADLDFKPGGFADEAHAQAVIDELSSMLHAGPVAVTHSGHGLQPYWALEADEPEFTLDSAEKTGNAVRLLRRWGRLVASVAELHGAQVDSVFDLPRVLRIPNTVNYKQPPGIGVATDERGGAPVSNPGEIFDEWNVPAYPEDGELLGDELVTNPDAWPWAAHTCGYAKKTIAGWKKDKPAARHPWLLSQAVRLCALHANGCLTEIDAAEAGNTLAKRFTWLLEHTEPKRGVGRGELADAASWARAHVARFAATRIAKELGNHPHLVSGARNSDESTQEPPQQQPEGNSAPITRTTGTTTTTVAVPELVDVNDPGKLLERGGPTEKGMAAAFATLNHHRACYCPDTGHWMAWDGQRWSRDIVGAVREMLLSLAAHVPSGAGWDAHHKRMLSDRGITAVLNLARTDPRFVRRITQFDAHGDQLNTPAGILDLPSGTLHPHDPAMMHTKITAVAPDFGADQSAWLAFLQQIFNNDLELIDWLQRVLGYMATGLVREHLFLFAHGGGNNGKGVLFGTIARLLGDYAQAAASRMLMARRDLNSYNDIAALAGARFVICAEVNENDNFDEARIKELTGGDRLRGRFLYQEFFDFWPTHHLALHGNQKPAIPAGGVGMWRRLRLVPFGVEIPEDQRDENLGATLVSQHGEAIMAWLAQGAARYFKDGLRDEPRAVRAATAAYEQAEDHVAAFLVDRCHHAPGNLNLTYAAYKIRAAYESWCDQVGERPLGRTKFAEHLKSHGVIVGDDAPRAAHGGPRLYAGIALRSEDENERADLR